LLGAGDADAVLAAAMRTEQSKNGIRCIFRPYVLNDNDRSVSQAKHRV
jgi:hypothetical protein